MQVSCPNNVKIYNLSAGKSLPQWLSDRRRRTLLKQDVDLRRRIELIQDFEMPTVSNCIRISKDQQYIFATGVYKPRVRCYDLNDLSMKFERCFDSEVVKFISLAEDYSKLVFLQCNRYIEFHAQHGKYYRTRIPKFGRDMDYHNSSADLYIVGASSEIYRLNLEQGRFLNSLKTEASEVMCCQFNPVHDLFACGTNAGTVECWDPRVRTCVGKLDCTSVAGICDSGIPAVTSLTYKNGLQFSIGTSSGHIISYDMRSTEPLLVKDHMYGLPIKDIIYQPQHNLVLSCDQHIVKIWNEQTGKAVTSIEPENTKLNNLVMFPNSGMIFLANEAPKILVYYLPSLGSAPRWCSFLDSLTEELEEQEITTVYDDYKFVTQKELEGLGLVHLVGSQMLRAYMHGYFMDNRLYNKAHAIAEPFAYDEYKKNKIKEKLEETRKSRLPVKKLPKVNRMLAQKLQDQEQSGIKKKKVKEAAALLNDSRFSEIFKNPDFQVDVESEEFRLLNPVVNKLDKTSKQHSDAASLADNEKEYPEVSDDDSSDDEHTWADEVKQEHRKLTSEAKLKRKAEREERLNMPKLYEVSNDKPMKSGLPTAGIKTHKITKQSFGDRLCADTDSGVIRKSGSAHGAMELTFKLKRNKNESNHRQAAEQHHSERRKIRRSASDITKAKTKYRGGYMGSNHK